MDRTHARLNPVRRGQGDHTHGFTQLLFGLGGTVHCELAAGTFDVQAGQLGLVPRHAAHFFIGHSDESQLLVVDLYLEDAVVQGLEALDIARAFDEVFVVPQSRVLPAGFVPLVSAAAGQLAKPHQRSRALAQQWATLFTVQAYELFHGPETSRPTRDERFAAFVDARRGDPPSNAELARHLYISSAALNRWAWLTYDMPPQQAAQARRLAWAHEALGRGESPVARIAQAAGFADGPSFAHAFRRAYGCSPSAIRRGERPPRPARPSR